MSDPLPQRFCGIVGSHPRMQSVFEHIQLWAPTAANILISGETGSGKELVAQAIHATSARAKRPFVVLDCSTLSKELLESELFGHEKGAFTGATGLHLGRFERANTGTLFLDEIANLTMEVQAKLLRVLQSKTFERMGGSREIKVDVRVVSASNRPLEECVAQGLFREDLVHRLNTGLIELPPLRERASDIPLLVTEFLKGFSSQYLRELEGFTDGALDALCQYRWPGNVRELRNIVERAVILTRTPRIDVDVLPAAIRAGAPAAARPAAAAPPAPPAAPEPEPAAAPEPALHGSTAWFQETPPAGTSRLQFELDQHERLLLRDALARHQDDAAATAKFLGLTKAALAKRLTALGLG